MFGLFGGMSKEEIEKYKKGIESQEALWVDVREEDEVIAGHLKGAFWLPLSSLQQDPEKYVNQLQEQFPGKTFYMYCRSGNRSGMSSSMLSKFGLKAENAGGFAALSSHFESTTGKP
jgi:phage shock protein E